MQFRRELAGELLKTDSATDKNLGSAIDKHFRFQTFRIEFDDKAFQTSMVCFSLRELLGLDFTTFHSMLSRAKKEVQ